MKNLAVILGLISFNVFAHEHLVGTIKGSNLPCSLEIEQIYYLNNVETKENLRADVVVSLEDEHHNHKAVAHGDEFLFTIAPSANPLMLTGKGSNNKDQVNVFTKDGSLKTISSFAVKWLHTNHFHSAQCVNLKHADH